MIIDRRKILRIVSFQPMPEQPFMSISQGPYLAIASKKINGRRVMVPGTDFLETFNRATRFFWGKQ